MRKRKGWHILLGLVIVTGLGGIALLWVYYDVLPAVRLITPPPTLLLEDRQGQFLSEGSRDTTDVLGYWALPDPLPPKIEAAFLAIEDKRFYQHSGVDLRAIARAVWVNLTSEQRQGASTIAMQVARMQHSLSASGVHGELPERTYWNKLQESLTAWLLVHRFGHQSVLRQYLTIVPQGNRIHGVVYAARRYFQKPLQDLSWAESALLAALPKAPGAMNLFRDEGRAQAVSRAHLILSLLRNTGTLSQSDLQAAQRQLQTLRLPEREIRPEHSYHAILRMEDLLAQDSAPPRPVRTTLDLSIQARVSAQADEAINYYRGLGAGNIAVVVVERYSGKVRAYLGSNYYYNSDYAGAINYARIPRSSGSTLKPFIYALGLERQVFTPASMISDTPFLVSLPHGYRQIGNYDGFDFGTLIYRKALANSRNVPAIHVIAQVGIEHAYELFRQLGLARDERSAAYYGVGMAIGTLYVTLEDLVAAYGVLTNEGRAFRLRWIENEMPDEAPEQWMSSDAARQICLFLADPLARLPVFRRMGPLEYPFPVAVKTGTSQGFRDAWTVACSSRYIVGVWIGHPEHTRMKKVSGLAAAQVAKNILLALHPNERNSTLTQVFPPPEGYLAVPICASTGYPATKDCTEVFPEYFRPGTEPMSYALAEQLDSISSQSFSLFAFENLLNAGIRIQEPQPDSTFILDPDTPRSMQTLSFRASVSPQVAQIIWHVDGKPFQAASYPYSIRWPLTPGTHTVQATFAYADVASDVITITVSR